MQWLKRTPFKKSSPNLLLVRSSALAVFLTQISLFNRSWRAVCGCAGSEEAVLQDFFFQPRGIIRGGVPRSKWRLHLMGSTAPRTASKRCSADPTSGLTQYPHFALSYAACRPRSSWRMTFCDIGPQFINKTLGPIPAGRICPTFPTVATWALKGEAMSPPAPAPILCASILSARL